MLGQQLVELATLQLSWLALQLLELLELLELEQGLLPLPLQWELVRPLKLL